MTAAGEKDAALCVLLVDDEQAVRRIGERALHHAGFRVLLAENGRRAVELYREHRAEIALVVLDMTMPEMNGADTFEALRQMDPEVRVLLSSGHDSHEAFERLRERGLRGVIQKPYRVSTLLNKVRSTLAG